MLCMKRLAQILPYLILILAILGVSDAAYLTYEHYSKVVPPCSIHWWIADCGKVLRSPYSMIYGVPLALLGTLHYTGELILAIILAFAKRDWAKWLLTVTTCLGLLSSAYFVYLMVGVIGAICWYCLGSAVISLLLWISTMMLYRKQ